MEANFIAFQKALEIGQGYKLATTITPEAPPEDPRRLRAIQRSSNYQQIHADVQKAITHNSSLPLTKKQREYWCNVFVAFWTAVDEVLAAQEAIQHNDPQPYYSKVYDSWKEVLNALLKGYSGDDNNKFESWTIPCLYVVGKYLRLFAIKADKQLANVKDGVSYDASAGLNDIADFAKHEKLEDAAREINRIFHVCVSDRAPMDKSRKWALYYISNLLFKTYFKLKSISLSKNILRSISAIPDMPPLSAFPRSHIVTFHYYAGVLAFLEESYPAALEHLTNAFNICHKDAKSNLSKILTYLIPCRLLVKQQLPSARLLAKYPYLQTLFGPLCVCIRRGDLAGFDAALEKGQIEFVRKRIYLTLERGRDIALRNLLRKVFIAGPLEESGARRTRVPVDEFLAAVRLGGNTDGVDRHEVECLIANMIYKNHLKGYIAHERGIVVLSKTGAFPGTGV